MHRISQHFGALLKLVSNVLQDTTDLAATLLRHRKIGKLPTDAPLTRTWETTTSGLPSSSLPAERKHSHQQSNAADFSAHSSQS